MSDDSLAALCVGAAVVTACVTSLAALRKTSWASAERPPPPVFQPRAPAFGIWFVIFAWGLAYAAAIAARAVPWDVADVVLFCASYACCTAWVFAFDRMRNYGLSFALIATAAVLALVHAYRYPVGGPDALTRTLTRSTASSLLGGWLALASLLGLVLWRSDVPALNTWWTPGLAAGLLVALSIGRRNPLPLLPWLWAVPFLIAPSP